MSIYINFCAIIQITFIFIRRLFLMNVYQLSAKNCMSHLLLKDTFDTFLFIEGEFNTFNKFTISGYLQEDFFDEKLEETYSRWEKIRDFCFQIIRGKQHSSELQDCPCSPGRSDSCLPDSPRPDRLPPGRHSGTLPQFPLRWKHPPMHHRHFPQNLFYG